MGSRLHSRSRDFTQTGLGVVGFILVCLGALGCDLWSWGSLGFPWVHSLSVKGRRFHSASRELTQARLDVDGFIFPSLRFTKMGLVCVESSRIRLRSIRRE